MLMYIKCRSVRFASLGRLSKFGWHGRMCCLVPLGGLNAGHETCCVLLVGTLTNGVCTGLCILDFTFNALSARPDGKPSVTCEVWLSPHGTFVVICCMILYNAENRNCKITSECGENWSSREFQFRS